MLLQDKVAVIYGGGGHAGGAIASAFVREGAVVHLAGRTAASLEKVAAGLPSGRAHVAVVDALDEAAVDAHAHAVAEASGRLDISVNVISDQDLQGIPMVDMNVEDYLRPIQVSLRSKYLTSRAAARHMAPQGSGVIIFLGGMFDWTVSRRFSVGGMGVTFDAVESLRRQLAAELGPKGIRAVTLCTGGLPETIPAGYDGRDAITEWLNGQTLTGRTATLADVGEVAAFAASDRARTITGAALNFSAGARID
ncbi:SDR family oxidoreductase [Phytohabitans flavus]|uniref:3-oxoacyl-ACP reductase n=1 Tax=Phytohabitans flavus TaxID=1076124 RepID=A0A6F8XQV5_9ACTN|nr:SDR family oxidoreductase [Phytohabitans flavus]BCB76187.1 3-oxoacyl-ACP reductase [Phytohabitans flavus]